MNVKTQPFNPSLTALVLRRPFSVFVLCGALSITGLVALSNSNHSKAIAQPAIPAIAPSSYSLKDLSITGIDSGTAVIKLDDLTVNVSFNFETHEDNYGVPGSEFTAVEITQLSVDHIVNDDGTEFRDFTNYNDHYNINQLIAVYIEKNRLVEAA